MHSRSSQRLHALNFYLLRLHVGPLLATFPLGAFENSPFCAAERKRNLGLPVSSTLIRRFY